MTFIHSQSNVDQIPNDIDNFLSKVGHAAFIGIKCFECGVNGEKSLERSKSHHDYHHDGENGNGRSGHVHDK